MTDVSSGTSTPPTTDLTPPAATTLSPTAGTGREAGGRRQPVWLPRRNLDLLRAGGVVTVVLFHTIGTWQEVRMIRAVGRLAVLLFFVHTALVLMSSLERELSRAPSLMSWVKGFYIRRAWRIYPLAIITVLLCALVRFPPSTLVSMQKAMAAGTVNLSEVWSLPGIVSNVFLVQNLTGYDDLLTVLWSLPIEMQMYVLLPLCYLIGRRSTVATLLVFAGVVVVGAFVLTQSPRGVPLIYLLRRSVLVWAPDFLGGVVAYSILARYPPKRRLPWWTWPFVLVALILVGLLIVGTYPRTSPRNGWFFALLAGIVIPFVEDSPPNLLASVSHFLAKYSYGIYLLHLPAIVIAFLWFQWPNMLVRWLVYAFCLTVFPAIAYHLIEDPGINFGARLASRGTTKPAAKAKTFPEDEPMTVRSSETG